MRFLPLGGRNFKEVVRDPISVLLGLAMPLFFLVLFTLLGKRVPVPMFQIANFAPGMIIFGFFFLTMFSALLLAQDKTSSFLMRLFASPLTATDFILSYTVPLLPLALVQAASCLTVAVVLGLPASPNLALVVLVLVPQALVAVFAGLLFGALFTEKQVQGVGNVYIILGSLLSGAWMDPNVIGGLWKDLAYALPFAHSIDAAHAALAGDVSAILPHLLWPIGYAVVLFVAAAFAFKRRMQR